MITCSQRPCPDWCDINPMINLGDGRRGVATARSIRNASTKSFMSAPMSHSHQRQNVKKTRDSRVSRVRGRVSVQVGRAETRDKPSPCPRQRNEAIATPYIAGEERAFGGISFFAAWVKL